MPQKMKDITGQVFGSLTAIRPIEKRSNSGQVIWECQCNCAKLTCPTIIYTVSYRLRNGTCTSCLMHRTLHRTIRHYYAHTKCAARNRDLTFDLDILEFCAIVKMPCYYCGDTNDIKRIYVEGKLYGLRANGIDRFDNSDGYTVENSVSSCFQCNYAKGTQAASVYINRAKRIALLHN